MKVTSVYKAKIHTTGEGDRSLQDKGDIDPSATGEGDGSLQGEGDTDPSLKMLVYF